MYESSLHRDWLLVLPIVMDMINCAWFLVRRTVKGNMSRAAKALLVLFIAIYALNLPIKSLNLHAQEELQNELTQEKRDELEEEKRGELAGEKEVLEQEEILRRHREYRERRRLFEERKKKAKKRFQYRFSFSAKEGYDNNVYLGPKRKGDMYEDISFGSNLLYRLNGRTAIKSTTYTNLFNYNEISDYSTLNNSMNLSLEYFLNNKTRLSTGYSMDFVTYLKNENGSYHSEGPFADLQYFVTNKLFIGCGYENSFYKYDKRKSRNSIKNNVESTREDSRHKISAEVGTLIGKSFLKVKNTYQFNDSNDQFMDYYDYQSDKTIAFLTFELFKNVKLILTGSYQRKDYASRLLGFASSTTTVREHLSTGGYSLNYNPLPSLNIIASYRYRQNDSNKPSQEYSGSMSSVGIAYSF